MVRRDYDPERADCGLGGVGTGSELCGFDRQLMTLEEYFQEYAGIGPDPQFPWTFNKPVERIRDRISTNSGDIIVFANARDGFQFYEKPLEAQHGSLTYADSLVPIVFAHPGATGDANVDDTLTPIKQFFQLLPKENVGDGGQAIQAIAEADALRAFFGLAFDVKPHEAN